MRAYDRETHGDIGSTVEYLFKKKLSSLSSTENFFEKKKTHTGNNTCKISFLSLFYMIFFSRNV